MNKIPFVSVIIPCRNEASHINLCINSILFQQNIPGGFEILVADGMSNDGTREILEHIAAKDERVRIIDNHRKIVPTGLNAAIGAARGEIILRMDAHSEYAPDYINKSLEILEKTKAENVGGPFRTKAKTYLQKANGLAFHSPFAVGGARSHNPDYEGYVDTVAYGCWKKETLEKIGLFDEAFVRNQDDELNLRLTRSGGKIWQSPEIKFLYYPRSSLIDLFKQYVQYGYWKVRVIQKHKIPASFRHLVPGGFVGILLILLVLSPLTPEAKQGLLIILGLYGTLNLAACFITCRRVSNWKFFPVMPVVFAAYHFGYGYGFLRGFMDFLLLGKFSSRKFSQITRTSGK